MLKCREIPDLASDFVSRDGSKRTNFMVALHLLQCRHCRTYVRGMKTVTRLAAASLDDDVPGDLYGKLGLNAPDRNGSAEEPKR
ncbi:hypothetical protein [Sinorhizobium arboris]|uniref:hypothetical protein n=1 Tax=Sinorhizobium arboris TaxID=76745 RepID=UPI00040452ED|nr:hypothetical protein [Sinorhizobium arboris]